MISSVSKGNVAKNNIEPNFFKLSNDFTMAPSLSRYRLLLYNLLLSLLLLIISTYRFTDVLKKPTSTTEQRRRPHTCIYFIIHQDARLHSPARRTPK